MARLRVSGCLVCSTDGGLCDVGRRDATYLCFAAWPRDEVKVEKEKQNIGLEGDESTESRRDSTG
jgi:hypothetical protein